jgi:hypothetical protein
MEPGMTRRDDTDPKALGSGNTDPGLGPPEADTAPGPARKDTTADALLNGLGSDSSRSGRRGGRPDSDGKLAAAYHASPRPAPARSRGNLVEQGPAVVVAGSEADTLDEPAEASKPASGGVRGALPAADRQHADDRPRLETTVPGPPSGKREKWLALLVTAAAVAIAIGAVVFYRSAVRPPRQAPPAEPTQVLAPRFEIPDPPPAQTIELDPPRTDPAATTAPVPPRHPAGPRASSKDGKNAPPPPDDFQDLKQDLKR